MSREKLAKSTVIFALFLLLSESASAQMFGTRRLGTNPLGRTRSLMEELESRGFLTLQGGTPTGGPRPNPLARPTRWSGSRSAGWTSPSTGPTFRLERAVPAPTYTPGGFSGDRVSIGQMYPPRLQVGFNPPETSTNPQSAVIGQQLRQLLHLAQGETVEVELQGEKAILRGVVASDRAKNLAKLLVLFEPGVSAVDDSGLLVRLPDSTGLPSNNPAGPTAPQSPESP